MHLSRNQLILGGLALAALIAIGTSRLVGPSEPTVEAGVQVGEDQDPHTVVFIVMDTVRAENTNLCGYARPNTPTLNGLRESGAAVSCNAHTPSFWTLPSHASYFTGLPVVEHGAFKWGDRLSEDASTLAEDMSARGYRTVMLAGNPLFKKITGLQQGFDFAYVQSRHTGGRPLVNAVRKLLDDVPTDEKLFLFVNIFDAHDPYPAIPEGVDWVEPQGPLALFSTPPNWLRPMQNYTDYTRGEMPEGESEELLKGVRNGYDYGIYKADQILGSVLQALNDAPRAQRSSRLLVTSDHGEFLGEHERLRHNCCVFEAVTRVPLLFKDSSLKEQPDLSGNLSALWAYHLVKDGRLPDEAGIPTALGVSGGGDHPRVQVAMWSSDTDKVVFDERPHRFDLATDPSEQTPLRLGQHPLRSELSAMTVTARRTLSRSPAADPEMDELLQELGYVDPDRE